MKTTSFRLRVFLGVKGINFHNHKHNSILTGKPKRTFTCECGYELNYGSNFESTCRLIAGNHKKIYHGGDA